MSFSVPTFNLVANIFDGQEAAPVFRADTPCNLQGARRRQTGLSAGNYDVGSEGGPSWSLLVPPGTDIRDNLCAAGYDIVEVPAGSGRFYKVLAVDDIAKGFPNEFRIAIIIKCGVDPLYLWPTPIP